MSTAAAIALELASLGGALALILAAAFLFFQILKRVQTKTNEGGEVAFVRALPVGPRERIMLVRWRHEHLLLGVTQNAITLLDRAPIPAASLEDAKARENPN